VCGFGFLFPCSRCLCRVRDFGFLFPCCLAQLAVGDKGSSVIRVFNPEASTDPVATLTFHRSPVTAMCFNAAANTVISGDETGVLEYWRGNSFDFPTDAVKFKLKSSTSLYAAWTPVFPCLPCSSYAPTNVCARPE
jgi:peptidylprolyl isomerase domain and WD repeat-containing protein 1